MFLTRLVPHSYTHITKTHIWLDSVWSHDDEVEEEEDYRNTAVGNLLLKKKSTSCSSLF